jgi:hypothetical protein
MLHAFGFHARTYDGGRAQMAPRFEIGFCCVCVWGGGGGCTHWVISLYVMSLDTIDQYRLHCSAKLDDVRTVMYVHVAVVAAAQV